MYDVLDVEAVLQGLDCSHINSKLDCDCLQSFVTQADQNTLQLNLLLQYVAADSVAANLLPTWVWHVICRTRTYTEWSDRLYGTGGIENRILDGSVCVKFLMLDPC